MRKNICPSVYFLTFALLFFSCKNNDFEIISNKNKLLKHDEILNLKITQEEFTYRKDAYYDYIEKKLSEIIRGDSNALFFKFKNGDSTRLCLLSDYDSRYLSDHDPRYPPWSSAGGEEGEIAREIAKARGKEGARKNITQRIGEIREIIIKNDSNQTIVIKNRDLICGYFDYTKEKLKGVQSKIIIKNNSSQIIKDSNLTVVINYTFETKKVFKYIKPYPIHNVWKKNETQEWNLEDVIDFAAGNTEIFKMDTPKNVTIEYYLTAKNSSGYATIENLTETINLNFYSDDSRGFGLFTSKPLQEEEILGLGTKIASENITNLWNKD